MSWLKEQIQFSRIEILGLLGIIGIGMMGIVIQYIPTQEGELYDLQLSDVMVEEEIEAFIKPKEKKYKPRKELKKTYAYTRVKFRNAGKEFRNIGDVLSIYGIDTSLVKEIKAHFNFPVVEQSFAQAEKEKRKLVAEESDAFEEKSYKVEVKKSNQIFDLNTSTKEELQAISGIGPKYASRIIKYRSILGGYSHKGQLNQVYGMTDSTFQLIKNQLAVLSAPEKIKINTVSQKELSEHYLVSYKMAKVINAYRDEHGAFVTKEDFRAIKGIESDEIEKIVPYLDFGI